ncbi:MAG: hypothetical protein ABJC74_16265 [Gemmatimonadota bacterium]
MPAENPSRLIRLLMGVVAGTAACGILLWPIPYSEVSLPGNPSGTSLLLAGGLAGFLAGTVVRPGLRAPILAVTLGFVLAVVLRVSVETSRDPTSHNLWPFEVVIAGLIGLAAAAIGVGLARSIQRAIKR